MATRQSYYAESTGESTKTANTFGDKVALTFTPDANSDYMLIWSALVQHNSVSAGGSQVRLYHDTATTVLSLHRGGPKDTTDYWSRGGVAVLSFGSSPASQTISIEYASEDNSTTTKIKEARIIAIKLDSTYDKFIASAAQSTNATTTFATKATLTFTPPTTGDYLVLASASAYNNDDFGDPWEVKLVENAVAYGLHKITNDPNDADPANGGGKYNWQTMVKLNLTNASKSFTIQYRNTAGTDIIGIESAYIVALRLDQIPDHAYNESRSRSTTTSTSPQTKATVTDTFAAEVGIIIGVGLLDHSVNTSSANARLVEGGSTVGADMVKEPNVTGTAENYPFFMFIRKTLQASSITYNTAYFAEAGTSGFQETAVAVLQLEGGDTTTPQTISGVARIEKAVSQTQAGKARITVTATKTQAGISRIQKSASQTIAGIARITKATLRTIAGVANINNNTLRTISGVARITATTLRTISGVSRIQISVSQTIAGLARITVATVQTIAGVSRITAVTDRTQAGVSRVTATATKVQAGISRVEKVVTQTISGVANIFDGNITQTISGVARIAKNISQTLGGVSRINVSGVTYIEERMQSSPSTGTVKGDAVWDSAGYLRLTSNLNDQHGQIEYSGNLPRNFTVLFDFWMGPNNPGADAIYFYFGCSSTPGQEDSSVGGYILSFDEYSGANMPFRFVFNGATIANTSGASIFSDSQWHRGKITVNGDTITMFMDGVQRLQYTDITRTLGGSLFGWASRTGGISNEHRIKNVYLYWSEGITIGVSRIAIDQNQTIDGVSRILKNVSETIAGIARIAKVDTQNQSGISRIEKVQSVDIQGQSRISQMEQVTQQGKSSIVNTVEKTATGQSRIIAVQSRTQTGQSRVTATTSHTISGVARIKAITSRRFVTVMSMIHSAINMQFIRSVTDLYPKRNGETIMPYGHSVTNLSEPKRTTTLE